MIDIMNKQKNLLAILWGNLAILLIILLVSVLGSRGVTTFSERSPIHNRTIVIVDPGHGGIDGGATSCSGVLESEINLQIATRLNDLLHLLGINTVMTRTSDISIHTEGASIAAKKVSDLKNRVSIVNGLPKSILISIHQNYYSDSKYFGPQVFYAATDGSRELASELQKSLNQNIVPNANRKTKKAESIYLLEKINCTGVLVECGFISNAEECRLLCDEEYQNRLCEAIVAGIVEFMN